MLMSFMDVAMGHAARSASGGAVLSTISLNCDFLAPARLGERVEAHVRILRRARSVVFLSGELVAGDRVLMAATGIWKTVRSP
jgi:acyl-coenzyme A thioesterase PaaI-like protein